MNNALMISVYNLTREQHELTIATIESALAQDIPVDIFILDNGSTYAPTRAYLDSLDGVTVQHYGENISPVKLANLWLGFLFEKGYQHVLGLPNDVIIPPNLYKEFLKWPRGIVTGSMTNNYNFTRFNESVAMNTCTPLCVALYRKWVWDALMAKDGHFFDERIRFYASDCDLALRVSACGIVGVQLNIQYFHYGSASHRLAPHHKVAAMAFGADEDRAYFRQKWGFGVADPEYSAAARDINFRG